MGFMGGLKKGGGFLNNVDGRIVGYEFTTVPPTGKDESEWVYLVPEVRQDGADKDDTQHLFLGAADKYEISDDGKTLTGVDEITTLGANTPAGLFLGSLAEKGGAELQALLPDLEGGDALNLENVFRPKDGVRVRFVQVKDEKGTSKRGQREVKDKKTGKVTKYDRTNTVISAVYEIPGAAPAKGAKSAPAGKVAAKGKAKSNNDEVKELASEKLTEILGNTDDGEIAKPKIRVKLMQALGKNPLKDAVIAYLFDDDNLAVLVEEGVITYDPSDKKQIISLA